MVSVLGYLERFVTTSGNFKRSTQPWSPPARAVKWKSRILVLGGHHPAAQEGAWSKATAMVLVCKDMRIYGRVTSYACA
jgi:hypothetical protein